MLLSIITINLNNKNGLQKTMESIITQTCTDFEWIVIDGNSTDGSVELIKSHTENITYWVSEHDNGIYDAMNKGINAAKGEYLLFLNSGDMLYSNDVIKHLGEENLIEDIIVYDILLQDGNKLVKKDLSLLSSTSLVSFLVRSTFPHQSTLIRRELFKTFGPYRLDFKYISDWLFFFQVCVLEDVSFIYKKGCVLSVYDMTGISSINKKKVSAERDAFLKTIFSERMYKHLKLISSKEKKYKNLDRPGYRSVVKCLLWISNKIS